jgi:hypothetical protein
MIGDAKTPFDPVLLSILPFSKLNSILPFSNLNLSKSMLTFFDITYLYPFELVILFSAVSTTCIKNYRISHSSYFYYVSPLLHALKTVYRNVVIGITFTSP